MTSNLQVKSSFGYGLAMAVSVAYFLFATPSLRDSPIPWIAGASATLASLGVGWILGKWYLPAHGERPTFELVLCPLVTLALSLTVGLIVLWAWLLASNPLEPQPLMGLLVVLGFGFPVFISAAWPAVVLAFGVVGAWLALSSRAAPNNSFKPTPLRGAA
jgi:hypothetical protein